MPSTLLQRRGWSQALKVYRQPRLLVILAMGFASGLPLALTGATLQVRLKESGVSLTAIGFFALVQLSYNFKALWAPFLDQVSVPGLSRILGRRRAWLIVIELALAASILGLGSTNAADRLALAGFAVLVAFLSASQDVVIDAYRIEILDDAEQGAGAAATQMGYRLGMLVSGAGALLAVSNLGWTGSYALMAGLLAVGMMAAIAAPRPRTIQQAHTSIITSYVIAEARSSRFTLANARDFLRKILPPGRSWAPVLAFLVLYKLGSSMAEHMAMPLYVDLGFTKTEIAEVSKLMGTISIIIGVSLGGVIVYKIGIMRSLLLSGVLQTATNGLYIVLARAGHDLTTLTLTISADNLAIGINSAAIVAYLSALCGREYTATQYALLSALMLIGRNLFASVSGGLADALGWVSFFAVSMGLAIPGLLMLIWLMRHPQASGSLNA